jgi:hypothetical protein
MVRLILLLGILLLIIIIFTQLLNFPLQKILVDNMKNTFVTTKKHTFIGLTYDNNLNYKNKIHELFLQLIFMLSEKNNIKIEECIWISDTLKKNILKNIYHLKVLSIENIEQIKIIHHDSKKIIAEIISKILNRQIFIKDTLVFEKKDNLFNLYLKHINIKEYTTNFKHIMEYIQMEKKI